MARRRWSRAATTARIARTTYALSSSARRRLMGVLRELGVNFGDRVATLAMNSDRHLELYYAISGMGAVCHTINPRLSPDDIAYILGHAEDGVIFVDPCFLPIVEAIAPGLADLRAVVVLGEPEEIEPCDPARGHGAALLRNPARPGQRRRRIGPCSTKTPPAACATPRAPRDGRRACCIRIAPACCTPSRPTFADGIGLRATDRLLPVVPMFHVNAWGSPYVAPMVGASLLMPGRHLDPASLLRLMNERARGPSRSACPPSGSACSPICAQTGASFTTLKRIMSGGVGLPARADRRIRRISASSLFSCLGHDRDQPRGHAQRAKPATAALDAEAQLDQQAKQGRVLFGVGRESAGERRRRSSLGRQDPGRSVLRGHWVASGYFRQPNAIGRGGLASHRRRRRDRPRRLSCSSPTAPRI